MMAIALGSGSRLTPVLAVPPSSSTWKVKFAYGTPVVFAAGANCRLAMLATLTTSPATTGVPLTVRAPTAGNVVILTPEKLFAGSSFGSANPKSAGVNMITPFSGPETVLSTPSGASFTEVTVMLTSPSSESGPSSSSNTVYLKLAGP